MGSKPMAKASPNDLDLSEPEGWGSAPWSPALESLFEGPLDLKDHADTFQRVSSRVPSTCCAMPSSRSASTKNGFQVTRIPVNAEGVVDPKEVAKAFRKETLLVSIMAANNETGAIQPFRDIGKICRQCGILFHTDAVQAYGKIPIDVQHDNIDLLSASAHKITTSHRSLFQQTPVRSSSACYCTFNLLMARSPGFGSKASN